MNSITPDPSGDLPPRRSIVWLWLFWLVFLAGAAALVLFSAKPLRELAREDLPDQDPRLVLIPAHLVAVRDPGADAPESPRRMPTRASAEWRGATELPGD